MRAGRRSSRGRPSLTSSFPVHQKGPPVVSDIRVGVIGAGGIAKAHVIATRALRTYFGGDGHRPEVTVIADASAAVAKQTSIDLGVDRWTDDWTSVVADDAVDMITIAVPNDLHEEVATASFQAGKHVMCEKPLAHSVESARAMLAAARDSGRAHSVDLNYRSIPAVRHIKDLVEGGAIGEVVSIRGAFLQDWGLDPSIPRSWKFERSRAGAGPMLSLGCHVIDLAHFLLGHIDSVTAVTKTHVDSRPLPSGHDTYSAEGRENQERAPVDIEDSGMILARFENDVVGSFEFSRISAGRKNHCFIEISGSEGAVQFDYERINEIQLATRDSPAGGYTRVGIGPKQDGGIVWTLGGLGVGFAETVILHMRDLMAAIDEGREPEPSFVDGLRAQEVVAAALESAEDGSWVRVPRVE